VRLTAAGQAAKQIAGYGVYTDMKVFGPTRAEVDPGEG
jgi:hypothetical protein